MNVESRRDRFADALESLGVTLAWTTPEEFEETLESLTRAPVVGTPLPFDGVSLPEWVDDRPTPATLESAATGVTGAAYAIADYGSVVLPVTPDASEQVSLFPDHHVAVVAEGDLLPDMGTALERLGPRLRRGESAIIATGPSATADMGSLVRGAHGPQSTAVVVLKGTKTTITSERTAKTATGERGTTGDDDA